MLIEPILSVVLSDILTKGYFIVKNYAGLPLNTFEEMVKDELNSLSEQFYIKGTNQKILECCGEENQNFSVYVGCKNVEKLFSQLTV